MREERFFLPLIGMSMNQLIGHPKGSQVYSGEKKKYQKTMVFAGVKRCVKPFVTPVTLHYYPVVQPGKRGGIPKAYDTINFAASYKQIEDHLVKFGILQDDTAQYQRASVCNSVTVDPDHQPGIWVVIREAPTEALTIQERMDLDATSLTTRPF